MGDVKRLHLSLFRKWFDEILSGKKRVEYRDIKPYYDRLLNKDYREVKFINGYGSARPYLVASITKIIKSTKYYEIHLGEVLESGNIDQ